MDNFFDDIQKKGLHLHFIKAIESSIEIPEENASTQIKEDKRTETSSLKLNIQNAQKTKKPRNHRKPKVKIEKRVIKNSKEVYDFIN